MPAWCTKANVPPTRNGIAGAGQDLHRLPIEGARRGFDHRVGGRQPHPALRQGEAHHTVARLTGVWPGSPPAGPSRVLIRGTMPKSPGVVRIAALGDIHLGRAAYGPPVQTIFTDVAERADVLALCGDLTDRGEPEEGRQVAKALAGARPADRRGAGQPRLRVGQGAGAQAHPVRVGDPGARRRRHRGARGRIRRGQGIRRRVRPPGPRPLGRGDHQAVRAGGGGRGAQAGDGAEPASHRAEDRAAALLADRGDGRGRAARRSTPTSAPAGWRSRSPAIRWIACSTATRTTARWRGGRWAACRSTTCRCRCCSSTSPTDRSFGSSR